MFGQKIIKNKKMECKDAKYTELYVNGEKFKTKMCRKYPEIPKWEKPDLKKVSAFIPGTIRDIFVKKGQKVKKGDNLLILEAMKMRNRIKAPIDGKVKKILVSENQIVIKNELLVELE
jgi:biotin carboxyl carrier protein